MRTAILLFTIIFSLNTYAGSQAPSKTVFPAKDVIKFAKQVEQYAAEQGAYAFILARQGRPDKELPEGITFTHVAIAIYSQIEVDNGDLEYGYAIHNLYQRANDPGHSDIIVDYPVDFFWGAQALKAGIIIPKPQIQQRLIELVASNNHLMLHNPRYSVVANPATSYRQNCTEFTLDMLQAAIYQTHEKERIKANNRAYFVPQPVNVSRLKLSLGSLISDGITLTDHKGKVATATFMSLQRYVTKYDLAAHSAIIHTDGTVTTI